MAKKLWQILEENKEKNIKDYQKSIEEAYQKVNDRISSQNNSNVKNVSSSVGNNSIQLPIKKTSVTNTANLPTANTVMAPMPSQQNWRTANLPVDKTSIKNSANQVMQNIEQKKENQKFINKSGISEIGKNAGYAVKNFGLGAAEGTAGIVQGEILSAANEAKKISEKTNDEKLKDSIDTLISALNPIYGITKKSFEIGAENLKSLQASDKNGWQKTAEILTNSSSGVKNMMSPVQQVVNQSGKIAGLVDKNAANNLMNINNAINNPLEKARKGLAEEGQNYSGATQLAGNVSSVVGNMVPAIVASKITGASGGSALAQQVASLGTMGLSAKGRATQEALNKGAELDRAVKIGDTKGMVEIGTELLTGGLNIFGKGALDDIVEKGINKKVTNQVLNYLAKQGVGIAGEVGEELISDILGTIIDKGTVDPNATYSLEDFGETALTTILSTLVLNAIGGGYTSRAYQENIQNMQEYQNNTSQNQQNVANNQTQNITNNQQSVADNQETENLSNIMNNKALPMQNYQYQKSDNVKIDNLRKDASKFFVNSDKANNYVKMLEQIISDKDIEIRLDGNLKTPDGKIANGSYSNGVITINPNSTRAGEFIAIHELTHAIGTDSMKNIVEQYRKSNIEFDNAVKKLLENYNATELTEEAMADVSAQLFGNQEFINNLAQSNPSMFRKIYNEIKYLWHQFRGYTNQNQFIEDLQYKWEQAYRNNKLNETTNYSIAGRKALDNIKNDSKLYNQAIGMYNYAQNMAKQGKPNKEITEQTGWFKDDTGKLKFSFSDKDMDLKNINFQENKIYNLGNILKHDTLFTFYPQLKNYKVEFKNLNKNRATKDGRINGSYSRLDKGIRLDINRANSKIDTEGTLIHEIQHAIQDIEGFAGGTSRKLGKRAYDKSIGEIEARDTANRFKEEKYNNQDLNGVLPESAKLDRNILEKMKDGLYNYLNRFGKGVSNEEINTEIEENSSRNRILVENGINDNSKNSKQGSFSMQDNQGRTLTKEQQEYFKNSKVRDENGNLLEVYHGTPYDFNEFNYEKLGENTSSLGAGFYFTDKEQTGSEYAKGDGNLKKVYLDIQKPMSYGQTTMSKLEYKKFIERVNQETYGTYFLDYGGIDDALMDYDYGGDDIDLVNAVHNASGLSWGKIYSILQETTGFDGIISDEGFLNNGETIYVAFNPNQIKYVDNITPTSNSDMRYSKNNQTWQEYLEDKFPNNGTRTNLKEIKANSPMPEKTIRDVGLPVQKSTENIEKPKKLTRKAVRKQLLEEMNIKAEDIEIGNDIKSLNFQFTDPIRVNEKVFGRELGQKINDATINKTKHNTAEKTRWLNKERSDIKELGIKARSKESAAVQKYGEKQYVDDNGNIKKYGDKELAAEFPNIQTQEKIKKAAEAIRAKYDEYIDQINETITALGYDAIPKRQDYMRHFQELGDIFSKTGVPFNLNDMKAEDLPTDINGLTELNKPGKNWFAQAQKRYGNKTTYDAITGIDGYLEGAGNLIYHTGDIQNYRALSELVRDTFGQTKGFDNLEGLSNEQIQKRIEDIQSNKLSKYAAWLDEQANSLAGKKGAIDRGVERALGRRAYKFMNTLKSQVGSNMTGFNVRSSLTNLISSTIAAAKTNKIALAKGTISTINNIFKNDGFIDKSDFLTSRFGSDSLSKKAWQKVSNAGQIFMTGTDYFTANIITRSKYYEGLQKGMTETEAMNYANDFASRAMGDRSQGSTAEVFNSKTLGLLTQFQLEVSNQWQYMMHDVKMDYQKNAKTEGKIKAGATVVFQLGQLAAYSYFFNNLFETLTGSRAAFDPIEIIKKLFGVDDDDKEKGFDQRVSEAIEMLVDNIPLGNLITGGGRIPISEATTGISTLGKKLTNQKNSYGGDISWEDVGNDIKASLPYWILPTGYSQARKTVQGLSAVINNGDYITNSKGEKELRFPVENKDVGDYVKGSMFGKYALPLAKDFVDRDYKRLSSKQTKTYENSNLPYKQYLEYIDAGLTNKEEKINYLNKQKWTENQKWNIFINDILSTTERKDGSSQAKDAQYIISDGVSKNKYMQLYALALKNEINMPTEKEYKKIRQNNETLEFYINNKIKTRK